jgi:hypothetical protein
MLSLLALLFTFAALVISIAGVYGMVVEGGTSHE